MRYVLPCLAIDEEELGHVQTKVVTSMLQKLGYPSTLPTEIRYGPVELGGLGLIDLRTELRDGSRTPHKLLLQAVANKPKDHEFSSGYEPSRPMTALGG